MGLFKSLFGKKNPAVNESGNRNADLITQQFSPMAAYGSQGMGQFANILGLNGADASSGALDDWWGSSGGQFLMDQGMDQIMGNRAAGGMLRSGGTSKAIEGYRSNLASSKLGEYMGLLGNMNQQALGAGGLITSAGQYSKGTGANTSGGGLGKALGLGLSILPGLFKSDPRLKINVEKVGQFDDGLGIYDFDYIPIGRRDPLMPEGRQRGVMATEVAEIRPWALGPVVDGYMTVDYSKLGAL